MAKENHKPILNSHVLQIRSSHINRTIQKNLREIGTKLEEGKVIFFGNYTAPSGNYLFKFPYGYF